ncbi:MAG: hypothetical protein AUJ52_10410 [Elusimicrobia bacterium CG1_02_63_36]|nr:MAG: hypothetical protein AUJ52_10410 [Elusimicrobia bacterium CG1_02_63_36]
MRIAAAGAFLLLFAGCRTLPVPKEPVPIAAVEALAPDAWPPLIDDLDAASLDLAADRLADYLRAQKDGLVDLGGMKIGRARLLDTLEAFRKIRKLAAREEPLNRILKDEFELYRVNRSSTVSAHFSAYYAPTMPASATSTPEYKYPLYAKPKDLIVADLGDFDPDLKGKTVYGRVDASGSFVPFFDRRAIDVRDALKDRGLEIAWLKSGFDRLNLHIQGSGILVYPDGKEKMARFAATNGAPYASVGLALAGSKAMRRDEINAESLRLYLEEHPEGEAWLLARNPRYTFFSLVDLPERGEPSGTTGRPLVAGRSIAIDPSVIPFGALAFASLPLVQADENGNLLGKTTTSRFLLCADAGGAIKGPGRVDLYLGHGPRAKGAAHNVWDEGELYILLKKLPARVR